MKKITTLLLIAALTCTLTACGNPKEEASETPNTEQTGAEANSGSETIYGKITGIVGNELEIALVKMPEIEVPQDTPAGNENTAEMGETMVAATMATATTTDNAETNVELTGESMTLNVPAGISIQSFGQEATLSSLQKGNLITVTVDNLDDKNVISIGILE